MRSETYGHASSYWALNIEDAAQAAGVIHLLTSLSEARTMDWEWADPVAE